MAEPHSHTLDQARAAKPRAQEVFGALAEVVGIGITRVADGYGLKVNLRTPLPTDTVTPTEVDGVPVRLEVVGQPRAQ
ncbi:hypothetical protein R5W23_000528 [Gemmata sp. JC673]|uniref:Uncharacterized protein n=1 Tax=Gemmata algarum TaxID=2975278 RepID=A0ABU5EWM7_9BACT|nr:hypothetical protein [Gemmata algarum]MDY3559535.1 hypothetical protein [Gemmata algarum]